MRELLRKHPRLVALAKLTRENLRKYPRLIDAATSVSRKLGKQPEIYRVLKPALHRLGAFSFLQAGANDGISHDSFREFVLMKQVHGILVEPLPFIFDQLRGNYRCKPSGLIFENCALSYPASTVNFFTLDPEFLKTIPAESKWLGEVAGMSREHVLKHLPKDKDWAKHIVELKVPAHTIEKLMQKNGLGSIDCLFLDLEGHEPNVLLNMDFEKVKPRLIVYEHMHLGEQRPVVDAHLKALGFTLQVCLQDVVATR